MSDELPQTALAPAAAHAVKIDPALVEAVQDEPEILTRLTRGQLMLVQDRMVKKVLQDPDASAAALAVVHERLSKNAKLEPGAGASGPAAAQVIINFVRAPGKETVVIQGESKVVEP